MQPNVARLIPLYTQTPNSLHTHIHTATERQTDRTCRYLAAHSDKIKIKISHILANTQNCCPPTGEGTGKGRVGRGRKFGIQPAIVCVLGKSVAVPSSALKHSSRSSSSSSNSRPARPFAQTSSWQLINATQFAAEAAKLFGQLSCPSRKW